MCQEQHVSQKYNGLTLIRIDGDTYDYWHLEQKQLKMAWSKNIFFIRDLLYSSQNV
jgi:hypothetical protein